MRIAEADSRARGWQGMGLGQQSFSTLMSSNVTASCSLVKPVFFLLMSSFPPTLPVQHTPLSPSPQKHN